MFYALNFFFFLYIVPLILYFIAISQASFSSIK